MQRLEFVPEDDFYDGFEGAAKNNGIDVRPYSNGHVVGRGKPYEPPPTKEPPVFDYQMKRFYAAVGFLAVCVCACHAADHGSFDEVFHYGGYFLSFLFVVVMVRAMRETT